MNLCVRSLLALAGAAGVAASASGQVVINEFSGEVVGPNDWEFVELFNSGDSAMDIGGYELISRDPFGYSNATERYVIPAGTVLQPGEYWVVGTAGTPNVDQVVSGSAVSNANISSGSMFEIRNETIELHTPGVNFGDLNDTSTLVDAVGFELWRGTGFAPDVNAQIGGGLYDSVQSAGDTGGQRVSFSRLTDGQDTDRNQYDFKVRPLTPGASNAGFNAVTKLEQFNLSTLSTGDTINGFNAANYVAAQVADVTTVGGLNTYAIAPSPNGNNAIIVADPTGGSNITVSDDIFSASLTGSTGFEISAYIETAVTADGSGEADYTSFGLGSSSNFMNRADPAGLLAGQQVGTLTGIAWFIQRDEDNVRLMLVEGSMDGGLDNFDAASNTSIIHADFDLLALGLDAGWFDLSIEVDDSGFFTAEFGGAGGEITGALTNGEVDGSFFVTYTDGSGANTANNRPATFVVIPAPGAAALLAAAGLATARRRRA